MDEWRCIAGKGGVHLWVITALTVIDGWRYGLMECHNCHGLTVTNGVPTHRQFYPIEHYIDPE